MGSRVGSRGAPRRRGTRTRLHEPSAAIARRALETLTFVPRAQLSRADVGRARELALLQAGKGRWIGSRAHRISMWLWTPDWEADLRRIVAHHDPHRAGAQRLLGLVDRRRERKFWRASP
jgi:hypothetical protein